MATGQGLVGNPFLLEGFPHEMPPLRGGTGDGEQHQEQNKRPGGSTVWLVTRTSTCAGVGHHIAWLQDQQPPKNQPSTPGNGSLGSKEP